jgi:hypothetical protein
MADGPVVVDAVQYRTRFAAPYTKISGFPYA